MQVMYFWQALEWAAQGGGAQETMDVAQCCGIGHGLESMTLEVFSNLEDSVVL